MADITNLQVDIVASTIAAPYGPIVRVTDLDTLPVPNENISLEFTMAAGVGSGSVFMSYEQLTGSDVANRILEQAAGLHGRVEEIKTAIANIYAVTNAFSAPHTYADLVAFWNVLRENDEVFKGFN